MPETGINLIWREKKPHKLKWLMMTAIIFFIFITLLFAASLALAANYKNKIYPGVIIGHLRVGGMTKTQATNIIQENFKKIFGPGFIFQLNGETKNISNEDNILKLNLNSLADKAYQFGRSGNWWNQSWPTLVYPIFNKELPLDYQFDKNLLKQKLQSAFQAVELPAKNSEATIKIINPQTRQYELDFTESAIGQTFNYSATIEVLDQAIKKFQNPALNLSKQNAYPQITRDMAMTQQSSIEHLLSMAEINLFYKNKKWAIAWPDFTRAIQINLDEQEQPIVDLNKDLIIGQLIAIAQQIDQPAVDAKIRITNYRATEFQASQTGQKLDIEKNYQQIVDNILNDNNQIELVVNFIEPKIKIENINNLGIKEKIGEGQSDFSGSPANRRHNIGIGAAALNGILIQPDEEFSLVKTLGAIDAEHGYLPELVIKQNKTTPEFGGGLCQIGTTIFRAALATGLPITARQNHSYRVIYYEPAGTDATIYDPYPDFKFINDTKNYILIQTKQQNNNLIFEFWGTSDSRKVSFEGDNKTKDLTKLKPQIFNITKPGLPKEIETTDLAPGEKKQIDHAHNGADTLFHRYITKADGSSIKETWKSHYVPWQAVFLVGANPIKSTLLETPIIPENLTVPSNSTISKNNL